MPPLTRAAQREAVQEEIDEIVCELLDVEPFELGCPSLWARPGPDHRPGVLGLLRTLECAFGVEIDPGELGPVADLSGVYAVVLDALDRKRRRPGLAA